MKYLALFFLCCCISLVTFAKGPITGVIATVTDLDVTHNTAKVEVLNSAGKDITAYTLSVSTVYANGKTEWSERMKDYGANLTERGEVLHPGSTSVEDESWAVRPGNPFVRIDVKVSAVVYSDQTADAADAEALGRIQSHRSAVASALTKSRDILERALADNSSDHPGAKASDEVKKLIKTEPADNVYLKNISDELAAAPQAAAQLGVSERDYLTQRLAKLQCDAARESRYAQIRRAQ